MCAGIMFFRTANDTVPLVEHLATKADKGFNDMEAVAQYWVDHPELILPLPIFDPDTYPDPVDPMFATNVKTLGCLFDGAAYGQVRCLYPDSFVFRAAES